MKKQKRRFGFLTFIIVLASLVGAFYFLNKEFKILEKFDINISKPKDIVIPKLKIIDEDSNSRPIAVMINNIAVARPHSGLADAFLNYEIIVEGGITRIMSVFKDKDTARIGSIRSARHYFLDYALENDAIYVHFGHSPKALTDIKTLGVDNLNGIYSSKLYWRDKTLKKASEHTAFTSMEKIRSVASSKKYRMTSNERTLLNYTTKKVKLENVQNSIKADIVEIEYSNYTTTKYIYDKDTGLYKRFTKGTAHTDYITKEQYTAKNIITYQIKNSSLNGSKRQTLDNIGSGKGYYITNGYAVPIIWEKSSRKDKTIYKYENGNEIDVSDGVTWIQIQPKGKKLKIEGVVEASSND